MLERVIREEKEDEAEDAVERNGQNHNWNVEQNASFKIELTIEVIKL